MTRFECWLPFVLLQPGVQYFAEEQRHLGVPPLYLTQLQYAQYCYDATWTLAYALNQTIYGNVCIFVIMKRTTHTSCVTQHVKMGYKSYNELIEHVFVKIISLFMSLFWRHWVYTLGYKIYIIFLPQVRCSHRYAPPFHLPRFNSLLVPTACVFVDTCVHVRMCVDVCNLRWLLTVTVRFSVLFHCRTWAEIRSECQGAECSGSQQQWHIPPRTFLLQQ